MAAEIVMPFVLGKSAGGGASTYTGYILDLRTGKWLDTILEELGEGSHDYTAGTGVNISAGYVISLNPATNNALGGVKLGATASDTSRPVTDDGSGNARVVMQEADGTHKGVTRLTTTSTATADAQSDTTAITPKAVAAMITSASGNYTAGTGIDITGSVISITTAYAGKIDKIGDVSGYGANDTIAGKIAALEGINYTGGTGVSVSAGYVISLNAATNNAIGGVKLGATASDTSRPVTDDGSGNARVVMQEADGTHKGVTRLTTTGTATADAQSDTTAITPKAVAAMITSASGNYTAGTGIDITGSVISITTAYAGKIDKIGDVSGYGANETIAGKIAALEGINYTAGTGVSVSAGYVISLNAATNNAIGGVKLGATASDTSRPVTDDGSGNARVVMQEADGTHKGVTRLTTTGTATADAQSDATAITPAATAAKIAAEFAARIWVGTQAQYDLIVTKDNNTLYFIKEETV